MRRIFLLSALALVVMVVISISQNKSSLSLGRIADRAERAEVIPEETRTELKRLIEMVNREGASGRNAADAARIERALLIKPVGRPAAR